MQVKFTYFKRAGKFYTEHVEEMPGVDEFEIGYAVRFQFRCGNFPGLRGKWEGYCVVQAAPDGVPRLIECMSCVDKERN